MVELTLYGLFAPIPTDDTIHLSFECEPREVPSTPPCSWSPTWGMEPWRLVYATKVGLAPIEDIREQVLRGVMVS